MVFYKEKGEYFELNMKKEYNDRYIIFIKNLKNFRKRHHMTQGDMAEIFGVSQSTVSGWENGTKPIKLDYAVNLAIMFGLEIFEKQNYFKCIK